MDNVRVYQRKGQTNIGCDGKDRPTQQYINDHITAYSSTYFHTSSFRSLLTDMVLLDPNITNWKGTNFSVPKHDFYYNGC